MKTPKLFLATRSMVIAAAFTTVFATPEIFPQDDKSLSELIAMALDSDEILEADDIKVTVDEGIAILTGNVVSLSQSERAAERAKSAEGIRAVVNQLKVRSPRTNSAVLAESIRQKLAKHPALDARRVKIVVNDRKAVLSGEIGSWDEQELAREIATEIPGLTKIENRLEVSFDTRRTDTAIRSQIAYQIADDPLHDGLSIDIEVKDGVVRLAGEVGSSGEKDLLVHRAHVTGVTEVWADDVMIVRGLSLDGMTGKVASSAPAGEVLRQAFDKDRRLRGSEIQASFKGEVLTLTGSVPSEEAKDAAESTARGLPGVEVVVNRIGEKGRVNGDRRLASAMKGR